MHKKKGKTDGPLIHRVNHRAIQEKKMNMNQGIRARGMQLICMLVLGVTALLPCGVYAKEECFEENASSASSIQIESEELFEAESLQTIHESGSQTENEGAGFDPRSL